MADANAAIVNDGKRIQQYRTFTANGDLSSTQYLAPTKFRIGTDSTNNLVLTDTSLDITIPIQNGTACDDGSNTMTGSSGADNSTDNTTTYKEGAGQTDVTAQNLIANNTNATKIWTIANLASAGTNADATKRTGLWLYIKDQTTLDKFLTSGTCLTIKLGSDASNYYGNTFTASQLSTGWNWLSTNVSALNTWTETGTVSGDIDYFIIEIVTNNATDTFVAGDVVYDLLRQWEESDTLNSLVTGYPSFDTTKFETTVQTFVGSSRANGFDVDSILYVNEDTTPLAAFKSIFTAESKNSTDEFTFEIKMRTL